MEYLDYFILWAKLNTEHTDDIEPSNKKSAWKCIFGITNWMDQLYDKKCALSKKSYLKWMVPLQMVRCSKLKVTINIKHIVGSHGKIGASKTLS